MADQEWYHIQDADKLDTPALVVYPERVKYNIGLAIKIAGGADRLRPHVKTHKSGEVTKLMLHAGITKFKCATIAEAEMLCLSGAPDVLLAYQPVGPKIERLIQLILKYPETRLSCLADNKQTAGKIAERAKQSGVEVAVFIDLNTGQDRTGIAPDAVAIDLYAYCSRLPGIKLSGLHAYDGHIHDADLEIRKKKCNDAFQAVTWLENEIVKKGYSKPIIVAGGSPTFPIHAERPDVECSPGTFVYWDKGYGDSFKEQAFLPAALVVTRVISLPDDTKICLDLGHKSIAAERELKARVLLINAPQAEIISQSEEHLVIDAGKAHSCKQGDIVYGMPYHVCPTVALYERAFTIENGIITGEWKNTARDRKITI
ncbi:MAG TPA: D-TA family PLP-dependent enzyme [Mucilaginibacter sp.]|nr:D-TA family PLP-dependent enzyme [Mucilaginibacter sp.]